MNPTTIPSFNVARLVADSFKATLANFKPFFRLSVAVYGLLLVPNLFLTPMIAEPLNGASILMVVYTAAVWAFFTASAFRLALDSHDGLKPTGKVFSMKGTLRLAILSLLLLSVAFAAIFLSIAVGLADRPDNPLLVAVILCCLALAAVFYPRIWFAGMFIVDYDNSVFESLRNAWVASARRPFLVIASFLASFAAFIVLSLPFLVPSSIVVFYVLTQTEALKPIIPVLNVITLPLIFIFMPIAYGYLPTALARVFRDFTDEEIPEFELKDAQASVAARSDGENAQ